MVYWFSFLYCFSSVLKWSFFIWSFSQYLLFWYLISSFVMAIRCLQSVFFLVMSLFLRLYALVRFFLNLLAFLDSILPLLFFFWSLPVIFSSDLRTFYSHSYIFSLTLPALKLLSVSNLSLSIVMISLSYPSNSCALILFHISRSLFFLISLICAWILIWKNVGRWSLSMSMVSSTLWFFISTSDSAIVQSISV